MPTKTVTDSHVGKAWVMLGHPLRYGLDIVVRPRGKAGFYILWMWPVPTDSPIVVGDHSEAVRGQKLCKRELHSFGDSGCRIDLNDGFNRTHRPVNSELYGTTVRANSCVLYLAHRITSYVKQYT